jgi:hypothetical protein
VEIIQQINRSNPFSSTSELHFYQLNGDSEKDAEALHKPVDIKHMAWRMVTVTITLKASSNKSHKSHKSVIKLEITMRTETPNG